MTHIHPLIKEYNLNGVLDFDRLLNDINIAIQAKAVNCHYHPTKEYLFGVDYSEKCQFEKMWDLYPVSKYCRGLVLDVKLKKIAALVMPKFFNISESNSSISEQELINCKVIQAETKEDGSCFYIFNDLNDMQWICKTRGSFISSQCQTAQKWLPHGLECGLNTSSTYVGEIIYPENRVIIDYGDYQGFVFFGKYNNLTGVWEEINDDTELKYINQPSPMRYLVRYQYTFDQLKNHLQALTSNEEGFVIVMPDGRRAKLKGEKYLELHKAKFGLCPISVWESMVSNSVEEARRILPEEFHGTFDIIYNKLIEKYNLELFRLTQVAYEHYNSLPEKYGRKEFAIAANKYNDKSYLMSHLKAYDSLLNYKGKEFNHEPFSKEEFNKYNSVVQEQQKSYILNLIRPNNNIL